MAPSTFGMEYLKNPAVAAALLQFGLDIGQPSPGGFMSQLTRAIGGGAAAAGRYGKAQEGERQANVKRFDDLNQQGVENQYRQATLAETQRSRRSSENIQKAGLELEKKKLGLTELFQRQKLAGGGLTAGQQQSVHDRAVNQAYKEMVDLWERNSTVGDPMSDISNDPAFLEKVARWEQIYSRTDPQPQAAPAPAPGAEASGTVSPAATPPGNLGGPASPGQIPMPQAPGSPTGVQAVPAPQNTAPLPNGGSNRPQLLEQARQAARMVKTPEQKARLDALLAQYGIRPEEVY